MSRLFALFGTDATAVGPVLAVSGARARVGPDANPRGYGVAYTHDTTVLLRQRPHLRDREIDLVDAAGELETTALLIHFQPPGPGPVRAQNTSPFRYGHWMYAQLGTMAASGPARESLLGQLSDSLRRNVGGNTDAELFFHLILARLRDRGVDLADWQVDPDMVADVYFNTLEHWQRSTPDAATDDALASVLTNGQRFFAYDGGIGLECARLKVTGKRVLPATADDDADSVHAVLVIDRREPPPNDAFEPLAPGELFWVDCDWRWGQAARRRAP